MFTHCYIRTYQGKNTTALGTATHVHTYCTFVQFLCGYIHTYIHSHKVTLCSILPKYVRKHTPQRHTDRPTSRLSSSLLATRRTVSSARHFSSVKVSSPFPLTLRTMSVRCEGKGVGGGKAHNHSRDSSEWHSANLTVEASQKLYSHDIPLTYVQTNVTMI